MYSTMQKSPLLSKINNHVIRLRVVGLTGDVCDDEGARGLLRENDVLSPMTGYVVIDKMEVEAVVALNGLDA